MIRCSFVFTEMQRKGSTGTGNVNNFVRSLIFSECKLQFNHDYEAIALGNQVDDAPTVLKLTFSFMKPNKTKLQNRFPLTPLLLSSNKKPCRCAVILNCQGFLSGV